jgi:hypothetical protein
MTTKTIVGVFDQRSDAERAINELVGMGVLRQNISYAQLAKDGSNIISPDAPHAASTVGMSAFAGATTGGLVGALAGLVVASGILPGLGVLFVAGPLAAALGLTGAIATTAAGALTGVAAGGVIGALTGLGVNAEDAKLYEQHVRRGAILMSVHDAIPGIADVLRSHKATEVREYESVLEMA